MNAVPTRSAWAGTCLFDLGLPEPPGELAEAVRDLGDLRAGTRPGTPALRGLGSFAVEARDRELDEYVLAGIEEISLGVLAAHYLVSYGRLFLALQVLLSPDDAAPSDAARAGFAAAAELQQATIDAAASGTLEGPGRLIVVDGAYGQRSWEWTGDPPFSGGNGIAGAMELIDSLR